MPLFYHGFMPTAILIMVLCLVLKRVYDFWKQYHQKL